MATIILVQNPNLKENHSFLKQFNDGQKTALGHTIAWLNTTDGAYKVLSVGAKTIEAIARLIENFSSQWKELGDKMSKAAIMLGPLRLVDAGTTLCKIVTTQDTALSKTSDLADVASTGLYSAALLMKDPVPVLNAANAITVVGNVADLTMAVDEVRKANNLLVSTRSDDVKAGIKDTRMCSILKVVKIAASLLSGLAGLLALVLGAPVVASGVLLGLGLISGYSAIAGHFYKESMLNKKIDL